MTGTVARTTPYAWPYDGLLVPSRLALLVVLPSGGTGNGHPGPDPLVDPALRRVADLAGAVHAAGGAVVEVTTAPRRRGVDRAGSVSPRLGATGLKAPTQRIVSGGVDGFYSSSLDATLRALGCDQLLLAGLWLETSVHSTMRSANDRGYECLLVQDACVALDPELRAAARSQIEMSGGIFGAVGETDAVLAALGRTHERTSA